jgi:hypothetical protein
LAGPTDEISTVLAYGADGEAKKYTAHKPYHLEVRAATATVNGPAKTQVLTNTFGLQEVVALWGDFGESGHGASWWQPSTGHVTIQRKGRYHINWSLFARVVFAGGVAKIGTVYTGAVLKRNAATTYNGGTYRKEAAVFRGNQAQVLADGQSWDLSLGGAITVVLDVGDEIWIRAALTQTSAGVTVTSAVLRDDNASWFTVTQLEDAMFQAPN